MEIGSDRDLISAARSGDFASFAKLYETWLPPVTRFARSHTASDAEAEALAEVILRVVMGHLDGHSGRVPFAAFVLVITRKVEAAWRAGKGAPQAASDPSAGQALAR